MENRTGQFIAKRRKAIGMTQKELAECLGVTNKAVSKWETGGGMPDISVLQELSRILEVSVDELLAGEYAEEGRAENRITERIATINPIATRNTPFIISLTMYQRMPDTQKAVRMIRVHIASPMYCAICLKFTVAVIAVSFVKFHDAVYPAV